MKGHNSDKTKHGTEQGHHSKQTDKWIGGVHNILYYTHTIAYEHQNL